MAIEEHVKLIRQLNLIRQGADAIAEWRKHHPNKQLDLSGEDFGDEDLSWLDLGDADFSAANLSGANLSEARLVGADFIGANLSGASLIGANLLHADFCEANLRGANLSGANLYSARLSGADLSGAACGVGTDFGNVDLSKTIGLDAIEHSGPSTLGTDTLIKSGKLPHAFLRGCGLPNIWIDYIPALIGQPIQFYSVFISYNSADKQFARQLHDRLQGVGIRCWLDEKQMVPGDKILDEIDRGIRIWDKILVCASRNSLENSWWVDRELEMAMKKERDIHKETGNKVLALIPLDLDGFLFSDEYNDGVKSVLQERLAADFRGWKTNLDKFEEQLQQVVRALRTDGGKPPAPEPKLGK